LFFLFVPAKGDRNKGTSPNKQVPGPAVRSESSFFLNPAFEKQIKIACSKKKTFSNSYFCPMRDPVLSRLVLLFVMACAAFSYPLLSIPDQPHLANGAPVMVWYLFGVWAVLILLTAYWVFQQRSQRKKRP
jgi:hypothetical protein